MKKFCFLIFITFLLPASAKTLIFFNLDRVNENHSPEMYKENFYLDKIIQEIQDDSLKNNDIFEIIYFSASKKVLKKTTSWSEINGPETMNSFILEAPNKNHDASLSLKEEYLSDYIKKNQKSSLKIIFFGETYGNDDVLMQIIKEKWPKISLTAFIKDNNFKYFYHHPSFELGGIEEIHYYTSLVDIISNPKLDFLSQNLQEDILYDFQNDSLLNQEKKDQLKALIRTRVGKYICGKNKSFGEKRRNCF